MGFIRVESFYLCCNSFSMMQFILFFFQVDSLEKLSKLLDACNRIGVETNPKVIDEVGIIPLFSWYHEVITYIVTIFSSSILYTMCRTRSKVFLTDNLFECSTCFFDRALTKRRT